MKNRVLLAAAAAAIMLPGAGRAGAEDAFQTSDSQSYEFCRPGPQGSCARFQGYVYVRRSVSGDALDDRSAAPPGGAFGNGRLYVHAGGAQSPDR